MVRETVHCVGYSDLGAAEVWTHLQDFAAPWHPFIDWIQREDRSDGKIIRRFATHGDQTVYREQLTYQSNSEHLYTYRALEGIQGAQFYEARLRVSDNATGGAILTWEAGIEAAAPRAKEIAEGTKQIFDAGLTAISQFATTSVKKTFHQNQTAKIINRLVGSNPELGLSIAPAQTTQAETIAIYLHGIGGNRKNWDTQLSALGGLMPSVSLDLRGYGDSTLGPSQTTMDDYSNDILTVMEMFKAKRIVLCGLSYGSWIAASFALRNPNKIAGLVLCGGCTGMSEADPNEREAFRLSREAPLDAGQKPADFADSVINIIAGPNATTPVRDQLFQSMAAIPAKTYRDALNCFCNPPEKLDFTKTDFPVLLMTGEHDKLAPPQEIRAVSQRFHKSGAPFVQFETIEGAGHVCNVENPDPVNTHLATFLKQLAPTVTEKPSSKATRRADKKRRILDSALREFSRNGFSGASMQAIAKRANVSKPTLYQYIGQKDAMFRAVLELGRKEILAPFENTGNQDPVSVLWNFSWVYADFVLAKDNLSIARLVIAEAERAPAVTRQFFETGPAQALIGIAEYLKTQHNAGNLSVEDPEMAADQLWSLILSGPRNQALHFPNDPPAQESIRQNIVSGLQVFLRSYATNPDKSLKQLSDIVTATSRD